MKTFDVAILEFIYQFSSPALDWFFLIITQLGGFVAVPIIMLIVGIFLWRRGQKAKAIFMVIGVGGAVIVNNILKLIFERPRPELWEQIIVEDSYSFPSGHAMASSALAICLVMILWRTRWRSLAIVLGVIYVVLIGLSRMYLGVHYPSDIMAGWLISLAWVGGAHWWVKRRAVKKLKTSQPKDETVETDD